MLEGAETSLPDLPRSGLSRGGGVAVAEGVLAWCGADAAGGAGRPRREGDDRSAIEAKDVKAFKKVEGGAVMSRETANTVAAVRHATSLSVQTAGSGGS